MVTVKPMSLNFGQSDIGVPSGSQTVTITNSGGTAAQLNLSVEGPFWQGNTCAATLPAGASCTARVVFRLIEGGSRSAVLNIGSSLPQVLLSGVGLDRPRSGQLQTNDAADRLEWFYEPHVAAREFVEFRLCPGIGVTWRKGLVLHSGNSILVDIAIQNDDRKCTSKNVSLALLSGGLPVELWKAKTFGISKRVAAMPLSKFMPLRSGSRLTIRWLKD